ncbi:hypothetical protein PHMEG_0002442 [Phytophthora megakarya]|uniref:Uncharacterized protein n=1 Tax=Phytophthora megakarya TaxID=4795 RepID=A0A225X0P8_9STRA|nr:hypothetical protein PHMEG_0002442 [Phytophthora megakarya]
MKTSITPNLLSSPGEERHQLAIGAEVEVSKAAATQVFTASSVEPSGIYTVPVASASATATFSASETICAEATATAARSDQTPGSVSTQAVQSADEYSIFSAELHKLTTPDADTIAFLRTLAAKIPKHTRKKWSVLNAEYLRRHPGATLTENVLRCKLREKRRKLMSTHTPSSQHPLWEFMMVNLVPR